MKLKQLITKGLRGKKTVMKLQKPDGRINSRTNGKRNTFELRSFIPTFHFSQVEYENRTKE